MIIRLRLWLIELLAGRKISVIVNCDLRSDRIGINAENLLLNNRIESGMLYRVPEHSA